MLDFNGAIEILKNNGFDSITTYPLVYKNGRNLGLTYTFDSQYGNLERIKLCETKAEFDLIVKQMKWYKEFGKQKRVSLLLDNYMVDNPNIKFIHNGQEINYEIMQNIDLYDENAKNELESSDTKRIIFEIERLFEYYNHIKSRLIEFIDSVNKSMEYLYNSYKVLQSRIDLYNSLSDEREYEPIEIGLLKLEFDIEKQNGLKDSFNHLKVSDASYEELLDLLKQVWSLCMRVELNDVYIKSMKIKNELENEQKLVDIKLKYMEKLLNKKGIYKGVRNLSNKFKRFERKFKPIFLDENYDDVYTDLIIDKYKRFNEIHIYNTSSFLEDALDNTNYDELVSKYKDRIEIELDSLKADENKVVGDLNLKYNSLSVEERERLILLNSDYYNLFDLIINVDDFKVKTGEQILDILGSNEEFKNIMSRCYKLVNDILPFNENVNVINIFKQFDFDSEEEFIESVVKLICKLEETSTLLNVDDDISVYYKTYDFNSNDKLIKVNFDVNKVLCDVDDDNLRYIVANLKKGTNVFYSSQSLIIPSNGESEIKIVDNKVSTLSLLGKNIIFEYNDEIIKVGNYRSTVVRDAGYSYVESVKSDIDFNFIKCEISKRM